MNTEITVENTRKQHIMHHMTSDEEHPVAAIVRDVMQREEILWNGSSNDEGTKEAVAAVEK